MVNLSKHTIHGSYMILWDMHQITEPSIQQPCFEVKNFLNQTRCPKHFHPLPLKGQGTQLIRPYVLLETFQIWTCCVYFDSVLGTRHDPSGTKIGLYDVDPKPEGNFWRCFKGF